MEKRQLLFVTHRNENLKEGISYAIELAKAMDEDIVILFVQKRAGINSKFDNLMTAVTFAEAGEHEAAKRIGSEIPAVQTEASDQEVAAMVNQCLREGVQVSVHTSPFDALSGIRPFIKEHGGVDKVVLSPAITMTDDINSKDIKRLVRVISRPVVTMARQSLAVAGGLEKV